MFKRDSKYFLTFLVVYVTMSVAAGYWLHGSFNIVSWLENIILFWVPAILVFKFLNRKNKKDDQENDDL